MFNFVRIMGRKDASLKINLGVPFKKEFVQDV